MQPANSFSFDLTGDQQARLVRTLREGNYRPASVPYTLIAADGNDCRIALYTSGKCLVQGKGAQDFVTFVLEPRVLQAARLGYEAVLDPKIAQPHMGVDESGKGDYFGPLVIASAYVDATLCDTLRDMGVRDSKRISSDARALALARDIRSLLGTRYSIVAIGPAKYNHLYTRIRNVNTILAWAHARAIENLLERVPDCPRAISDQFGSKAQVTRALMQRGKRITLEQLHRAESDLAVAAASILAREGFLLGLRDLSRRLGLALPKGASAAVQEAAVDLIRKHGPTTLTQTAKCHFKVTDAVLSQVQMDRAVLGPDGVVRSRPSTFRRRGAGSGRPQRQTDHGQLPTDHSENAD